LNETALLALLQQKDESAFRELVTRFQDRVFNTCMGILQHEADAEDAAQEVFLQVYQAIHKFKGESSIGTWIYRVAVSKCLDQLRKKKRKKRLGLITPLFGNGNAPIYEQAEWIHPGIQQERKEDAMLLFKMINALPENQRIAFLLHKLEDLNYREIAEILGISEGAVDSLLQRSKQNLRKKLSALKKT
jgi:RNA polymerase sigma factor (sigma-70 family)